MMGAVVATHRRTIGPNRVRHTIHFTRRDMLEGYALAARKTALDLPSKGIVVYTGEDVVLVERNLV